MKIGEALTLLKKEKSRLARLISTRKNNIFVEKGKEPTFNPKEISKQIEEKTSEIRNLKIAIQKTNLNNTLPNKRISIAEAIIKINDIRNNISNLSNLFENKRPYLFYRDKDELELIPQLNEKEVEKEIELLETEKSRLDNELQKVNWSVEITK